MVDLVGQEAAVSLEPEDCSFRPVQRAKTAGLRVVTTGSGDGDGKVTRLKEEERRVFSFSFRFERGSVVKVQV